MASVGSFILAPWGRIKVHEIAGIILRADPIYMGPNDGGPRRDRTGGLLIANQALSQLS